jgi:GrpB-like predicted nucleotidyltransferase (UPF0157 family)
MNAIKVVDYDPEWPALFAAEQSEILSLLGDLVDAVHHIGSTSVPGLAAKPKIDIDAVLRSEDKLPAGIRRIQAIGIYAYHGDPYGDRMWTFTRGTGSYGTRLYLCGPGNEAHEKRILFRDWLRAHPDDAAAYEMLKRRLVAEANGDWKFYTGGKSYFVAELVRQALDEGLPLPVHGERMPAGR